MYNQCVEMDNIIEMELGNSYNGLYIIVIFNLQEKCLVLLS